MSQPTDQPKDESRREFLTAAGAAAGAAVAPGVFLHTVAKAEPRDTPVTDDTRYLRHLPHIFARQHQFRALPAIAKRPFRDQWAKAEPGPRRWACSS